MSTAKAKLRKALARGRVAAKFVKSLSCFPPVSEKRTTRWVQQWAKTRRSGHCVHRPVLVAQMRIIRERNGVTAALDFRDRILRIAAYPTRDSFWEPGKTGPDYYQYRLFSTRKMDDRTQRKNIRFWLKRAGVKQ